MLSKQMMKMKKNINQGIICWFDTKFSELRIVWQTVRRITYEILGVKGLIFLNQTRLIHRSRPQMATQSFVLMTTFPNKELSDETQKLSEANLLNAVIVQRFKWVKTVIFQAVDEEVW